MQPNRSVTGLGVGAFALLSWILVGAQPQLAQQAAVPIPPPTVPVVQAPRMPIAPPAVMGASVTPALEGWFKNADGTATILIGYMNRNRSQTFDIPVGPNNKIEPGGPDFGQPTHFLLGRNYGVFSITVPRDFGTKRYTYTITANGQPQTITLGLANGYMVEPFFRNDNGNTPPVAKVEPTGPEMKGPVRGISETLTGNVGEPVTLTVYATDKGNTVDQQNQFGPPLTPGAGRGGGRDGTSTDGGAVAPGGAVGRAAGAGTGAGGGGGGRGGGRGGGQAPVRLRWTKYRGPGDVSFSNVTPEVAADAEAVKLFEKPGDFTGKATVFATFSAPGEYVVRGQVNDASGDGGGGDQCCWTNVQVKVNVRAAAAK